MTLREGSTLYYATRSFDDTTCDRVVATMTLFRTLGSAVTDVQEPQVAEKKIHWWHEEIERLYQSEARHPDTQSVSPWITEHCPDKALWLSILAVNNQLRFVNTDTESAFAQQLIEDYGSRLTIVNCVVSPPQQPTLPHSVEPWTHSFAEGLGTMDKLLNFNQLHHHGHMTFAEESWDKAGLKPDDAFKPEKKAALEKLIHAMILHAESKLNKALAAPENIPTPLLKPLSVLVALRQQQLALWRRNNHNPLTASMSLTPIKKAWCAWRTTARAGRQLTR